MEEVSIEELIKLRESGLSYEKIVRHLISKGITENVSISSVTKRIKEYYEARGQKVFTIGTQEIDVERLVKLREEGLSYEKISRQLRREGINISMESVNIKITEYYRKKGKEVIKKARKETRKEEVSIEELIELREKGLSYQKIVKYLRSQGKNKNVNEVTVAGRIKAYYESIGQKPFKIKKPEIDVDVERLVKLREEGWAYERIARRLRGEGIDISTYIARDIIKKYYQKTGQEEINKVTRKKNSQTKNETVETIQSKTAEIEVQEEKESEEENLAQVVSKKEEQTSFIQIGRPEKHYDETIKYILMNGMTVNDYITETGETEKRERIRRLLKKLIFIAWHSEEKAGQWIHDREFDTLIRNVENNFITYESEASVKARVQGITCKRGTLEEIKDRCFKGNVELTVYILTRLGLYFRKSDVKKFEELRTQYEKKVDKYLERLKNIEENIARNKEERYEVSKKSEAEEEQK